MTCRGVRSPRLGTGRLSQSRTALPLVVTAKLLAFTVTGVYAVRWNHLGMEDGLRVLRGSLAGTLVMAVALLLVERTGLSRGVLAIDFLTCSVLLLGARLSFRFMEGTARHWSQEGTPAVVLGPLEEIGLVRRALALGRAGEALRAVAVADPDFSGMRARVGGMPLYGGEPALENALHDTRAPAVVVVDRPGGGERMAQLEDYLARRGAVDVYRLRVEVERVEGTAGPVPEGQEVVRG